MKLSSLKNKSDFDLIFEKNNLKVSSGEFSALLVFKNKKEIKELKELSSKFMNIGYKCF